MKRILLSLSVIAAVAAVGIGATSALFSDSETAAGNTFSAGTLNLRVGEDDSTTETISLSNLAPEDEGNAAEWLTSNTGSIAGDLSVEVSAITNDEEAPGPESETNVADPGDLGSLLTIALWMDVDKDGTWSAGDYYLPSSSGVEVPYATPGLPAAAFDIVDDYSGDIWADVQSVAGTTDAGNFRVEYDFPSGVSDNDAQGDSAAFDITFSLEQS